MASLNAVVEGKIEFSVSGKSTLKMVSQGTGYFPIAVKAHRLMFNKGQFENVKLISDNQDFFKYKKIYKNNNIFLYFLLIFQSLSTLEYFFNRT